MFHNPSILLYYAEARHSGDLCRLPPPDQFTASEAPARPNVRHRLTRLFTPFRASAADTPAIPLTRRSA